MCSRFAPKHSDFLDRRLLLGLGFSFGCSWITFAMASQPSATAPMMSSSSPAVNVAAHRSCKSCNRRMSSFKYGKHTLCISCRDVTCSVDVRFSECSSWSTESMAEYLCHRRSLVSKGKKKPVTTPSSSSPSVPPSASPSVSSQSPSPSLTSIADDKLKQYVQSVLASMLSQPGSQVSLGTNHFISAPMKVPDVPFRGSTGGEGRREPIKRSDCVSLWCGASICRR